MAISQIAALTAHISFLLWELIFGRPDVGRSTPHQIAMIDSYSESSYLANPSVGRSTSLEWQFHRLLLWQLTFHSYSESSYLADQVLPDLTHPLKWWFHRFLLWQLIYHSYSETLYLADQLLADLPPASNDNDRFLLWEPTFGRPHIGTSTPPLNGDFTDASLWQLTFHSYSESSYLADQVLADLIHPRKWWFHRFLLWQLIYNSYSETLYLADQLLADLPPASNDNDRFLL